MFRKPRKAAHSLLEDVRPSTGRAPTPPATPAKTPFTLAVPPSVPALKMAKEKANPTKAAPLPTIGRQGPSKNAKKSNLAKAQVRPNGNIMAFFQKAEQENGLFVAGSIGFKEGHASEESMPWEATWGTSPGPEAEGRFNEDGGAVKRRKITPTPPRGTSEDGTDESHSKIRVAHRPSAVKRVGPFLEQSDSEDGDDEPSGTSFGVAEKEPARDDGTQSKPALTQESEAVAVDTAAINPTNSTVSERPAVGKEKTSTGPGLDDFQEFEGMADFDEDQFEEGDECVERRYMEEQAHLEAESNGNEEGAEVAQGASAGDSLCRLHDSTSCPICGTSLQGVSEQTASTHVNNCLDGAPTPLPAPAGAKSPASLKTGRNVAPSSINQFRQANRAPRPAQASPFALNHEPAKDGSAFKRLMTGHAEDAAWKEAAAAEQAARGKPAYQRICPFYKILPGLFICVDAFRYGAVEGCQAYFLSHFHSDHYVGLTSSWNHGPIYCSKVTANLVRQQLRVDPQYVVALDFEQTVEVSGTRGASVTMIPANHCPGSSLYLFEKALGKKPSGEPRLQRILHCGDFRACRAHIEHPLLMPDVQSKLSGKTVEQKIDVCYLDTTYLNPKYAFPRQESVVKACADMCVSMGKHSVDETDGWEEMKRSRAGEGMAKFIRKESRPEVNEEATDETDGFKLAANPASGQQVFTTPTTPNPQTGRGRLLVVVGTYSIGKERICLGIAQALGSKIYAPPTKQRIVAALEDPELDALMTCDPRAAQVHMTPLFEIRAETLDDYLRDYFPHFTRAVGFRPSGWNYRPPNSRFVESPSVQTVLHGDNWKSPYSMKDLVPQRGSTSRASCFGVPYSEHSSFRELTMFCTALRIERVIPTVNVGSAKSRERMKTWCERWTAEKKKNGLFRLPEDGSW